MAGVWIRRMPVPEPPELSEASCPICFEPFKALPSKTSCNHEICHSCLELHLKSSNLCCPICRAPLFQEKAELCFPHQPFDLGLFILNQTFFCVPGSIILLRVFEPRYLALVRNCIQHSTCFGLQAGFNAGQGLLVWVKRYREIEGGQLIIEGLAISRYTAIDPLKEPTESTEIYGLYLSSCKILKDQSLKTEEEDRYKSLGEHCRLLLDAKVNDLCKADKLTLHNECGPCPLGFGSDFIFWVLEAIDAPLEEKVTHTFSTNLIERMEYVLKVLANDTSFSCLVDQQQE